MSRTATPANGQNPTEESPPSGGTLPIVARTEWFIRLILSHKVIAFMRQPQRGRRSCCIRKMHRTVMKNVGWPSYARYPRNRPATGLHALAAESNGRVLVEMIDINIPEQIAALRSRLTGERIDILFVNAGVSNGASDTIPSSSREAFVDLMVTNALSVHSETA